MIKKLSSPPHRTPADFSSAVKTSLLDLETDIPNQM